MVSEDAKLARALANSMDSAGGWIEAALMSVRERPATETSINVSLKRLRMARYELVSARSAEIALAAARARTQVAP